jgi:hypothetical protein
VGTSIFKIELKIMSRERKNSNDPSLLFKEKEKEGEGRSKVGGQRKEKRRFFAWWLMEGKGEGSHVWRSMEHSKLGGQWKVKEKYLFTFSHFPPNQLYFYFFPLTLRFYFTMVLGYYSRISFHSLIYKLQLRLSM